MGHRLVAVMLLATLAGCRHKPPAALDAPPPVVTVAHPVPTHVQAYYEYNGNLDAVETVEIKARVKGFLTEIRFTEGTEVKEGDLLFRIDPRDYKANVERAKADRLKATAELKRAKSDEDRVKKLRASGSISEEDFAQRVAARETAEAVLAQTQAAVDTATYELGYTEIHSPINGQISRTLVTRGNLVGQSEPTLLTTIVSMDPVYVYFDVPERDLVEYQRSLRDTPARDQTTPAWAPVEVGVATEEGYPHKGRIDFRENRVDVGTGTVRIRGRLDNPLVQPANARLLYPGLYARVRVPAGPPRTLPAITEDALMTGQEGRFVYVLDGANVVQKRTVTVGPQVAKALPVEGQPTWTLAGPSEVKAVPSVVAIEKGLTAEDRVVVNGLTKARPGSAVAPEAWELKPPAPK